MSITIDLPPAVEERLRKEAESKGLALDEYAVSLIEERLPPQRPPAPQGSKEWLERLDRFLGSVSGRPEITPESLRREYLYNMDEHGNRLD